MMHTVNCTVCKLTLTLMKCWHVPVGGWIFGIRYSDKKKVDMHCNEILAGACRRMEGATMEMRPPYWSIRL